jgi:transposase
MTDVITTTVSAIGIDLGDKDAYYAFLNANGELMEEGRIGLTPAILKKTLPSTKVRIAIEAGAQSRWVSRLLKELGHEVIVANPRQVQLITCSNSKNDPNDAKLLAKLARVDPSLLSPLEHRDDDEQKTLLSIRARAQLVKSRVTLMHSLRGMAKGFGIRLPHSVSDQFLERCQGSVPQELLRHLEGLFKIIQGLTEQIAVYDEQIEKIAAEQYPVVEKLRKIPGVGTLTALTFVATIGDPTRFAKSRAVGAHLGLRPRQQQSGGKNPQLGITKAGDSYLRKLLVQSAHCVLNPRGVDTALKQWGLRLCERGGSNAKKRAIVAVARKLAVLLHKLWVSGESYRPFPSTSN